MQQEQWWALYKEAVLETDGVRLEGAVAGGAGRAGFVSFTKSPGLSCLSAQVPLRALDMGLGGAQGKGRFF